MIQILSTLFLFVQEVAKQKSFGVPIFILLFMIQAAFILTATIFILTKSQKAVYWVLVSLSYGIIVSVFNPRFLSLGLFSLRPSLVLLYLSSILYGILFYGSWALYFLRSKRVKNTFKNKFTNPKDNIFAYKILFSVLLFIMILLVVLSFYSAKTEIREQVKKYSIKPNAAVYLYFNTEENNFYSFLISLSTRSTKSSFKVWSDKPLDIFIIQNETIGVTIEDFLREPERYHYSGCVSKGRNEIEINCDVSYGRVSIFNPNEEEIIFTIWSNGQLFPPNVEKEK